MFSVYDMGPSLLGKPQKSNFFLVARPSIPSFSGRATKKEPLVQYIYKILYSKLNFLIHTFGPKIYSEKNIRCEDTIELLL